LVIGVWMRRVGRSNAAVPDPPPMLIAPIQLGKTHFRYVPSESLVRCF